jgi:ubiquinone/menaquinone biosynthesis C-methylase UbiE
MPVQLSAVETTQRAAIPIPGVAALTLRFAAEFREMPGLHLTARQAARLFGVETTVALAVLDELRRTSVLVLSTDGKYSLSADAVDRERPSAECEHSAGRGAEIYSRPDVYDMEYEGARNHDARFFARLLTRIRPRRVLEFACGTGRVTFTLAAALPTAEIVGVDASADMLRKAQTVRDAATPSVRERVSLVEGDMRDWPGSDGAFDAVLIPCCSVSHLLTLDDRRRTWATAFRLLRPGGVFILDVRMPDLATLAEAQRVRPRAFVDLDIDAARGTSTEEARLLRCTATTYEPHLQRADVRLLYDRFEHRALAERLVTDFASHVYFPAELELLFQSAGFEIAQQYGDYGFVRFDRTSPYVVTVARRPRRERAQHVHLAHQPAEHAHANRHVQPERLPVAEPDLQEHHHEQSHADAGHPGWYAASPPQDDSGDGLDEGSDLQDAGDEGVSSRGASVSGQKESR